MLQNNRQIERLSKLSEQIDDDDLAGTTIEERWFRRHVGLLFPKCISRLSVTSTGVAPIAERGFPQALAPVRR
jgi:hypothetical protein